MLECIFRGYRLRGAVRNDLAFIDSASQLVEAQSMAAERAFKCWQLQASQVSHCSYSKLLKPRFGHFAYTGQAPHGKRRQKGVHVIWLNHEQTRSEERRVGK